uniref:SWIM-type domain-containing protein n=1 Tax=Panagrolaimus davidi TaxID=227884 RepID=A0A914QQ33_9BILA
MIKIQMNFIYIVVTENLSNADKLNSSEAVLSPDNTATPEESIDVEDELSASLNSIDLSDEREEFFQPIEKHSHSLFEHVHNVFNCNEKMTVSNRLPYTPPHKKGTYVAIVPSTCVKYASQAYNICRLSPWSSATKKPHYEKICLIENSNGGYKVVQQHKPGAKFLGTIYFATHPKNSNVKKWVYSGNLSKEEQPPAGTFIVIVYENKEDYELPPLPDKIRMQSFIAAELRPLVMSQSGKEAAAAHNSKGHLMSNDLSYKISDKQIGWLADRTDGRRTPYKQGRPAGENFDEFQKQVLAGTFIRASAKGVLAGKKYERYFMGTDSAFALFENELSSKAELKRLKIQVDQFDSLDTAARYNAYATLQKSSEYAKVAQTGILSLDQTYNVSKDLLLTPVLFTSKNFLSYDDQNVERPAVFVVGYMLSLGRANDDFLWLANCLSKQINSKGKSAKGVISDWDYALDSFGTALFITELTTPLGCNVHARKIFASKCANDKSPMIDLFGFIDETDRKHVGIFDIIPYESAKLKLDECLQKASWQSSPDLIKWGKSDVKFKRYYDKINLKARVYTGYCFKEPQTNTQEGQHNLLKNLIKDHTPLHILCPLLEKYQKNQIESFGKSLVNDFPVKLRDRSQYLGPVKWAITSDKHKIEAAHGIGIKHLDQLPQFAMISPTFPQSFMPNTSEETRRQLVDEAKTYDVMKQPSNEKVYIAMKGDDHQKVDIFTKEVKCGCSVIKKGRKFCVHILAVHLSFPQLKIFDIIESFLEAELYNDRRKRESGKFDGTKLSHPRRTGNPDSKNKRKEIYEMVDFTQTTPESSTLKLAATRKRKNHELIEYPNAELQSSSRILAVPCGSSKKKVVQVVTIDDEAVMFLKTLQPL